MKRNLKDVFLIHIFKSIFKGTTIRANVLIAMNLHAFSFWKWHFLYIQIKKYCKRTPLATVYLKNSYDSC